MSVPARPLLVLGACSASASAVLGALVAPRHTVPGLWAIAILAFFLAGAWAHRQAPDNGSARRLLLVGLVATTWYAVGMVELLRYDDVGAGGALWALNAVGLGLDIALPVSVMALLATYPEGVTTSRPVRVLLAAGWLTAAVVPVGGTLLLGRQLIPAYVLVWNHELEELPGGPSSVTLSPALRDVLVGVHEAALALFVLAGAVVLAVRYRAASADDRVRFRWVALAGLLLAVDGVFTGVPSLDVVPAYVSIPLIGVFPVLVAIGIARPDLLDVDEALRRTALFALLWAAASLALVGVASALGVAAATAQGAAAAVPVTLAATLAFYPAWQALLRRVSRRLLGSGLDGDELLRRLGQTLEHTLEPEPLVGALAGTIRDGLGVDWVRISLDGAPVAATGIALEAPDRAALTTAVQYDGVRLGSIECGPRSGGALRPSDAQRLRVLGNQVGLAAHNARLAEKLAASRARIVEAEERGRRRIERDIHDGIQPDLVALIAHLGLVQAQQRRGPDELGDTLSEVRDEAGRALADLRELAAGIHPSVLGDRGIVDAIEARAARLPIGVTVDDELRGVRFPELVEGAAYFIIREALTNAIKHSGAQQVSVCLTRQDRSLVIAVSDDGVGFDVSNGTRVTGTGLAGLADRVDALGGRLDVESRTTIGTTLRATLPTGCEEPRG